MSDSDFTGDMNLWLLVSWVGSTPEESLEIIHCREVVFDSTFTPECLKVNSCVMVKCGRTKSPALVRNMSENFNQLMRELKQQQSKSEKENEDPVVAPKLKRQKTSKRINKSTQTNTAEFKTNEMLCEQNRKLKAELYEAHKLINGMCKDIKTVITGVQKKLQDTDDHDDSSVDDRDGGLSCPFEELPTKVLIGSGKTEVNRQVYTQINWSSYAGATRKLLMAIFPRDVLATHSLTGKPSPAFQHLISEYIPSKEALDSKKVADIIQLVTWKCRVSEAMVRSAITTKCADENKMYKRRLSKCKNETEQKDLC